MIIRSTETAHKLFRYGGVADGKTLEVRLGTVRRGIRIQDVPTDLRDNLTKKELDALDACLRKDFAISIQSEIDTFTKTLTGICDAIDRGDIDEEKTESLHHALGDAVKRIRQTRKRKTETL